MASTAAFDESAQVVTRFPDASSITSYVTSSAVISAVILYLYSSTFGLNVISNLPIVIIVSGLVVAGLSVAYSNSTYTT
ncbi:hypothetical protein BC829DRAFT_270170 [Chytridium lagenaria]|nr:hypothetical protein BC829DRAFT_270170 [Chytridium lagenaria]